MLKKTKYNIKRIDLTSVTTDVQTRQACISLISWANSDIKQYCWRKQNIKNIWSNKSSHRCTDKASAYFLISWANSDIKQYCLRKQNITKKIWSNKRSHKLILWLVEQTVI